MSDTDDTEHETKQLLLEDLEKTYDTIKEDEDELTSLEILEMIDELYNKYFLPW